MASQYFAILTNYGTQAFAKALSSKQPLQLATFAVGDGNGQAVTPTENRTALVREKHRANVSAVTLDPRNNKQVIVELTIPENVGGFYIREMGVFDNQNKLIAYANSPESYKPTEDSGSGKVQVLRMILKIASSDAVTLSIDNSVIFVTRQQLAPKTITATTKNGFDESGHSHEIERASISQAGIVQLTDDTGLDSDKLGLTARAGKKLAQWIANLQLALNNYIPNSKKSSRVDSNSADDVATSAAVKIAYDKAVEANNLASNYIPNNYIPNSKKSSRVDSNSADDVATSAAVKIAYDKAVDAKNVADNAVAIEDNATYQNSRIRIGWLRSAPYGAYLLVDNTNQGKIITDNYLFPLVNSNNNQLPASVAGVKIAYDKGVEAKTAADKAQATANDGINRANNANMNAERRVPKNGDTEITGRHFFKNDNSWISVISTTADTAGYDLAVKNGKYSQVTYAAGKVGNYGVEARIFITPEGANFDTDRRQHAFSVKPDGALWTLKYGLLHDYFHHAVKNYVTVKQEDGLAGLHINRSNGKRARVELINDTQWKFWLEGSYDIFLPKKGGTVALLDDVKTVARKDYSRTIKGTRPDWDNATSKNISVTGYVCIYPDGRIEQFFYFRNFRVNWFDFEPIRDTHFRQVEIPVQLWTAMPTKVTWVEAHISRTNDTNIWSQRTVGAEAGEWTKPIWAFEKQGSIKDRTNIYTRRINGDTGETVDMMIKVEGY